jgi:prepilin-type N-terminal cleavage/methylation domain-containing protein
MKRNGFTLLEVMVATLIMGIAVAGVLSALSTSVRSASRLTAYDRAAMLSRSKMDELLTDKSIPFGATLAGNFDDSTGWTAQFTPYVSYQGGGPGTPCLERVQLEIWWNDGAQRQTFALEGFRQSKVPVVPQT